MIIAATVLMGLGMLLLWLSWRGRARSGLPQGHVTYSDTGDRERSDQPLFSAELRLTGKPDYLVNNGPDVVPVEVKSRRAPGRPYRSHRLQLAAYCTLVNRAYGRRPTHGILAYADRSFRVDYSVELEEALLRTLDRMRADLRAGRASRNHSHSYRCAACGHRDLCGQKLT